MPTTLEKIQRLEQYLTADSSLADPVMDTTIDKLLARERSRLSDLKIRLEGQCKTFEENYNRTSTNFYTRYKQGELGDEMDYIEWAATIEMLKNVKDRLTLLEL